MSSFECGLSLQEIYLLTPTSNANICGFLPRETLLQIALYLQDNLNSQLTFYEIFRQRDPVIMG